MATTPNLGIEKWATGQFNTDITLGTAWDRFDGSNNSTVDVSVAAGGTVAVTSAQKLDNVLVRATGAPGSAVTLEIPNGTRALHIESAISTTQTITIDTAAGAAATIDLAKGESVSIDVRGNDYSVIGSIGLAGAPSASGAFGRKSEYIPAAAMQPSITKGCSALQIVEGTAGRPNAHVIDFDDGATVTLEEAQFQFVFPNRWDKGTITFQAYYTHVGGQTGGLDGVAWELSAVQIADDAAWDTVTGTGIVVTLDRANANDVHVTAESTDVTIAGTLVDSDMCFFILRRKTDDAADDLDLDARLFGIRIFWTEDAAVDD